MNLKKICYLGLASLMVAGVGVSSANLANPTSVNAKRVHRQLNNKHHKIHKHAVKKQLANNPKKTAKNNKDNLRVVSHMRKPISFRKSSETIPYPNHLSAKKDRIVVSLKKQRAYLMRGKKLLYKFYVSTGKNVPSRRTPKGHYQINSIRQYWFYAPSEHEGARYAVGWIGGEYLFHETPSNAHQKIIKSIAKDLGKKGSSYGCIHLSTSDAKWFYHNAPTGMPVIIK